MTNKIRLIVSTASMPTIRRAGITGMTVPTLINRYVMIIVTADQFPLICRIAKTLTSGIIWKLPEIGTKLTTVTDNVTGPTVTTAPHWINGLIDAIATVDPDGIVREYHTTGTLRAI